MIKDRRFVVMLTDAQYNRLKKHSDITGSPISEIIRRAITKYFTPVNSSGIV